MAARNGLGKRLAWLREGKNLSQRELADQAGVSFGYVARIERGSRKPSVEVIRMLAAPLGVTAHYLETGDEHGTWVYVTARDVEDMLVHGHLDLIEEAKAELAEKEAG